MKDFCFMLLFLMLSMLFLIFFLEHCVNFYKELVENVGKGKVLITKLADFLPRRIEQKLQEKSRLKQVTIDKLLKSYKRLCIAFSGYVLANLIHIACIIKGIMQVIDYLSMNPSETMDLIISLICLNIILSYLLFIVPVIKIFCGRGFIEEIKSNISDFADQVIFNIFMCVLSFIFLCVWISHMETFVEKCKIELTLWSELGILIIYQYLLLIPISYIVHLIILALDKALCWVRKATRKMNSIQKILAFLVRRIAFCKQYTEHNQIYPVLKNCTYFVFVLVYTFAIGIGDNGETVAGALGVLFLIDTFFSQEKAITKEVRGCKDDRNKKKR